MNRSSSLAVQPPQAKRSTYSNHNKKIPPSICSSSSTHLIIVLPLLSIHLNESDLQSISLVNKEWYDCMKEARDVIFSLSTGTSTTTNNNNKTIISVNRFFHYFHNISQLILQEIGCWETFMNKHSSALQNVISLSISKVVFRGTEQPQIQQHEVQEQDKNSGSGSGSGHDEQVMIRPSMPKRLRSLTIKDCSSSLKPLIKYLQSAKASLQQLSLIACEELDNETLEDILSSLLLPNSNDATTGETSTEGVCRLKYLEISKCLQYRGMFTFSSSALHDILNQSLLTLKLTHNPQIFSRSMVFNFPHMANRSSSSNVNALATALHEVYSVDAIKHHLFQPTGTQLPCTLQALDVSFTSIGNRDLLNILSSLPYLQSLTAVVCKNLRKSLVIPSTPAIAIESDSIGTTAASTTAVVPPSLRNGCCQYLHTLSLKACTGLTSLELVSLPSLTNLDVTLCHDLQALTLGFTPRLTRLYLPMLKKLDRLELGSCCMSLSNLYIVGCENLLSSYLGIAKSSTANSNGSGNRSPSTPKSGDRIRELLVTLLNEWQINCPKMDWNQWIEECIGGSLLFTYIDIIRKWWELKQLTKQWNEYAATTPTSPTVDHAMMRKMEDEGTPSGSTKVTKRVTIEDDVITTDLDHIKLED